MLACEFNDDNGEIIDDVTVNVNGSVNDAIGDGECDNVSNDVNDCEYNNTDNYVNEHINDSVEDDAEGGVNPIMEGVGKSRADGLEDSCTRADVSFCGARCISLGVAT